MCSFDFKQIDELDFLEDEEVIWNEFWEGEER